MAKQSKPQSEQSSEESGRLPAKSYEHVIARWTKVLGASTIVLAVATMISAYFLFETDRTIERQVDAARIQLRAYVGIRTVLILTLFDKDHRDITTGANISVAWKNFGSTPAKDFRQWISMRWVGSNFEPDFTRATERFANEAFSGLGPGDERSAGPLGVKADEIKKAGSGDGRIFLWGRAEYRDFFPGTPVRVFHFCAVAAIEGDVIVGFHVYKTECNYSD